jgi:hypothetical protein
LPISFSSFRDHADGLFRTFNGANAAALAIIIGNANLFSLAINRIDRAIYHAKAAVYTQLLVNHRALGAPGGSVEYIHAVVAQGRYKF